MAAPGTCRHLLLVNLPSLVAMGWCTLGCLQRLLRQQCRRLATGPRLHKGRRIVTGFGSERVEDLVADERRREAEGARRGVARREEGTRGHMTSFGGEDLDRAAGGPWQAGRR